MKIKKCLLLLNIIASLSAYAQEFSYDYSFFNNSRMPGSYFFSKTTARYSSIKNTDQQLPVNKTIFHTPGNSLQLEYVNDKGGAWQAFIYRQQIRGQEWVHNITHLSFWVFLASPATARAALPVIQLVKKDSGLSAKCTFVINQPNHWQQVLVPFGNFIKDGLNTPGDIKGIVFSQQNNDPGRHTIYIDDIELLRLTSDSRIGVTPAIAAAQGYPKHVDISWDALADPAIKFVKVYRSTGAGNYHAVGIQSPFIHRYADYTGETGLTYNYKISFLDNKYRETKLSAPVTAKTKSMTDEELLSMVQEASFRYYWEGAEKSSGLAKENIPGSPQMIATGASGFGIMALIAGTERKFITRKESVERFVIIVNFLENAATFHGVFPHFIDGPTGKAIPFFGMKDNGGDLVETSFLFQGLLAARAYFNKNDDTEKMIREKITRIWSDAEWDWYKQFPDSKFLYWHWSSDQAWVINHNLIGWNETMVTYLLAIASPTHAVPASMYYTGWANQEKRGQQYRSDWGGTKDGSMYSNGKTYYGIKLAVGVSNGGPLFFTHYSYLGYDPHMITDKYTNYFTNNKNIALINYRYCLQNPGKYKGYGDSCWGLTAAIGPYDYGANEPVLKRDGGVMAPTGAISSFPYTPVESMKALKNYYNNYGSFLWGEYGFRDAFDLTRNWCSQIYMGLNQATMVVMIENYRTGLIWKLLMSDTDVQQGMQKLNRETSVEKGS